MRNATLQVGQSVKLVNPENAKEAAAVFTLVELNGDRCIIRLVCGLPIPPCELVRTSEVQAA